MKCVFNEIWTSDWNGDMVYVTNQGDGTALKKNLRQAMDSCRRTVKNHM